ncbi:LIC_10190 family membrane protein [Dysgonomonas reticulitermitis]
MLAIFISWITLAFVLLSFGDMLLALSEKIRKQPGNYNLVDKLLAGLCLLIIPLSVWSLWMPSNHIFLLISIAVSSAYWSIYRKRALDTLAPVKRAIASLTKIQTLLLIALILFSLYLFSWDQEVYDSLVYHHQNIRWNEEYAVVPGLGNLDDKFGFNSNYFLLSSIFTFRFLFGEAIYPVQSFFVTAISCWVLYVLFKSNYEIKRVVVLISYILLFWVSIYFLGNTSTDILPNFIVFYIIARLILHPKSLTTNNIIYIILPVFLLTCKLSFFPVCIFSVYLLYLLIKEKKYKELYFLISICSLIVIPWLIRNVIISGYLVYPLYQVDLFSFDWKVPREVAIQQKDYIFAVGYYFLRITLKYPDMSIRDPLAINILADIIYLFTFISMSIMTYYLIKHRRKAGAQVWLMYSVFLIVILVWATGGPDIRFISGILCAAIFTGGTLLLKSNHLPLIGKTISFIFVTGIIMWNSYNLYSFSSQTYNSNIVSHISYKPYSVIDRKRIQGVEVEKDFTEYPLNNGIIILVNSGYSYDILPSTVTYAKFLPIDCLEARGSSLQDGFKAKESCK